MEADGTVDAQNAPTAPWKTLRVFHELPQGLSHRITHAKPRKAPKWRWETRIDPDLSVHHTDLRADALRLHLTLQDDLHYAERRQALLRRKVEQCASTFRTLLDRDPLTTFRHQLQQDLDELGRFESLPWGRGEPRDQVLHLAVGPLDELADVHNRSFTQVVSLWSLGAPARHRPWV